MAPLKIAVSLDNVPLMLRAIVVEALRRAPDIELVAAPDAAPVDRPLDALIAGAHPAPEAALREGRVKALIDIRPDGREASVHRLRYEMQRIEDPSPERLLALLRDAQPPPEVEPPRSRGRLYRWLVPARDGARPPHEPPPAPTLPPPEPPRAAAPEGHRPDAATLELTRLATKILAARAPSAAQAGPAAEIAALAEELAAAASNMAGATGASLPGLARAVQCFGLREDERDLLLLAALVEVDPRAARMVSLLNDHMSRPRPTLGLVRDLGGQLDVVLERLVAGGPLLRLALVSLEGGGPLATQAVKVSDALWPLLLGLQRTSPFVLRPLQADRLEALAMPGAVREACAQAAASVADRAPSQVLVLVAGDCGVGRHEIAEAIAAQWRPAALVVTGGSITGEDVIAALSREALWSHAAVVVTQAEAIPAPLWRALTQRLEAPLLATTAASSLAALVLDSCRPPVEVRAPRRDAAHRRLLWQARAPAQWTAEALDDIAECFDFGIEQIDAALALARARAATASGGRAPKPGDARSACETLRETRFAGAAERIECPFEPGDIVLRAETRRELDLAIAWARHARRLFGPGGAGAALRAGEGLACLFSGPPGSGKTMAAQILAREVGLALFRVDLSQVVDKFIGESEKKLAAVFDEAERARVALFFDEADALFGKRTEVRDSHDRYANITVDYLLQRLEGFGGLAILATNFSSNIDDAFLRRVRIRATFAAPDAADRRRIWENLLPEAPGRAPDIDVARLADPFELVGGEIRNAIYTAHLLAAKEEAVLSMRHCVAGLWRELGKTGRIPNVSQLGPWKSAVSA
jgi:Ni,Fe-hydrogenase III small subunit